MSVDCTPADIEPCRAGLSFGNEPARESSNLPSSLPLMAAIYIDYLLKMDCGRTGIRLLIAASSSLLASLKYLIKRLSSCQATEAFWEVCYLAHSFPSENVLLIDICLEEQRTKRSVLIITLGWYLDF